MFDEFDKTFGGVFPSPIGELHFSIADTGDYEINDLASVSVPYRGATFLNKAVEESRNGRTSFRPLSGSYISQLVMTMKKTEKKRFPSPIGELHFSIEAAITTLKVKKVSVPYRGATFLNIITERNKRDWKKVSVPYRGATFLNSE